MTIENKKLLAEIVQHWVVSISILFAGIWAFYEFVVINEDLINRKPSLTTKIEINTLVAAGQKYLRATVEVSNGGNDAIWVELGKSPLVVTKVNFDEKELRFKKVFKQGYKAYYENSNNLIGDAKELSISPDSSVNLPFLIKLDEPGLYYVVFSATQRHEASEQELKNGGYPTKLIALSIQASDYIAFE